MFLHIGENICVRKKDIVAIIDRKAVDSSKDTKIFIENMIKDNRLYNKNVNDIKTYIITCVKKMDRKNKAYIKEYCLYTSSISSITLSNRKK